MVRYIDVERLCNGLREMASVQYPDRQNAILGVISTIENMPTSDVEEVRHGEWKVYEEGGYWNYDCPFCDNGFVMKTKITPPNYCEGCGAKMDGGKTE